MRPETGEKFQADQEVHQYDVTDLGVAHLRVQEQEQGTGTWNVVFHGHHPLDTQSRHALRLSCTIEGGKKDKKTS